MTKPKLTFDEHLDKADAISAQTPESCINRSDIIRMAREARMPYFYGTWEIANLDGLERFAKLVAAHERQWVGLTEEEIEPAADQSDHYSAFHHGVSFAEAKLKEKNT